LNKFYAYITLLILSYPILVSAQYSSSLNRFTVDNIKGCAPLTVNLVNNLSIKCPCDVRYGDGTSGQDLYSHTYTTPGTYRIEIDYQTEIPRTDFIDITVVDNSPPVFEIQTCNSNRAKVVITDTRYDEYLIDFDNNGVYESLVSQGGNVPFYTYPSSGTYTVAVKGRNLNASDNCSKSTQSVNIINTLTPPTIQSVEVLDPGSISLSYNPQANIVYQLEASTNSNSNYSVINVLDNTIPTPVINNQGFTTDTNYYCFRISAFDPCTGTSIYSNEVCSVSLALTINDGSNSVVWNNLPGSLSYQICENSGCINTSQTQYINTAIVCGTEYCYQVISDYGSGIQSISSVSCGIAFSTATPSSISNLSTGINVNQVQLDWNVPIDFTPASYFVQAFQNDNIIYSNETTIPGFVDLNYQSNSGICYILEYIDVCNNRSTQNTPICPLTLKTSLQDDNTVLLNWNLYEGYSSGVLEYRIEKYDLSGALISTFTTATNQYHDTEVIPDTQIFYYRVFAHPNDNQYPESYSDKIQLTKRIVLSIPNAFTPNGDGLNDTFRAYGLFVENFKIRIFNRWGELVFSGNSIDDEWDGSFKNKKVPNGPYTYTITVVDISGNEYNRNGIIHLIRP